MKRFGLTLLMTAALALAPKVADAAIIIDFGSGLAAAGGNFTLLAGGHASGTSIPVGVLSVDLNGAVATYCTAGTGGNNSICGPTSAVLNFNTQTNFIQIIGGIPGLGIANGTLLLSGTFFGWVADTNGLHNAVGPDTKATSLLTALGIPTNTPFAYFGFSLTSSCIGGNAPSGACTSQQWTVISTDIKNTAVPEPGSMLLLGTGLLGLATLARRRMRKA